MELPSTWEVGAVGSLFDTMTGSTPPKSQKDNYGGDVPFVKPPELLDCEIGDTADNLSMKGAAASRTVPSGSILISCIGNLGKVGITEDTVAFNQQINAIKHGNNFVPKFVFYQALSPWFKRQLESLASGTTVPIVNKSKFNSIQVGLPPIPEQKRIVAILDQAFADIDKARDLTEQNLKNARELFESYLQQVFSQSGKGWIEVPLGEICSFKHGFAFKSEYFVDNSSLVLLTPGNFYEEGGYRDRGDKQKYYEGPYPQEFLLSKGDLLVAMTEQAEGLLGSPALIPEDGVFLHNQRLGLVQLSDEFKGTVDRSFLYHLFNTRYFRAKVQETASGLKVRHTSPKKMQEIRVSIPSSIERQKEISESLFKLKEKCRQLESIYITKAAELEDLKKSLLQKAFSGELIKDSQEAAA